MRLGVVLEAFLDRTLDDTLDLLRATAPQVTDLEVGVGGFGGTPHADVPLLLGDAGARRRWLEGIEQRGFRISALNVSGNPLDPDPEVARKHDDDLRNAVRLAARLGVDRVIAMAGCPPGAEGDRTAHFDGGGWLPHLAGIFGLQWEEFVVPYWSELIAFARAEQPNVLICIELHPGTCVYNVETFERLAAIGDNIAANLDPSHLFWQRMDPLAIAQRLPRIGHAHAKDVVLNEDELALNGLLDHRWSPTNRDAAWTFAVVGRGHGLDWWRAFLDALAARGVPSVSIEYEDPNVALEQGIADAASLLETAVSAGVP
jgi:sugar phosphate isomerase/epimerase